MDRRSFLKTSGIALAAGELALLSSGDASASGPLEGSYMKYLNPKANIGDLTESAKSMPTRDRLLKSILDKLPTPERAVQIYSILAQHIEAEEARDTEATMATMVREPIFECIPEGVSYRGHQSVSEDYARRYSGLTRKLHLTNVTVDAKGAFAEMLWEGQQVGTYKGIKPVKNAKKFYIPMVVYYEVSNDGLIARESVYYDQYLGTLSLEIIPDILTHKLQLLRLNPKLIVRKGKE